MQSVYRDTLELKISSDDLVELANDRVIESDKRTVVGFKGEQWSFIMCIENDEDDYSFRNYNGLMLYIQNYSLSAKGTISINYGLKFTTEFEIWYDPEHNTDEYRKYEIPDLALNDMVKIDVTFTGYRGAYCSEKLTFGKLITWAAHYPADTKLAVGDQSINVYRFFMRMVSPVFYDKLRDKKVDRIEITEASFEGVNLAIGWCYGNQYNVVIPNLVHVLRFANAYRIQPITNTIEPLVESAMSCIGSNDFYPPDFGYLVDYMWDHDKYKSRCARIYRDNAGGVGLAQSFADIDDDKLVDIVRTASNLKDDDTVGRTGFQYLDSDYFPKPLTITDFLASSDHFKTDAQFVIGDKVIDVHRDILCLISPVFQAAFAHDTKEARTGKIELVDFEFQTVKNVLDYCYGRNFDTHKNLWDHVNMLRFAEKYDIKIIINEIKPHLGKEFAVSSFSTLADYAWDFEVTDLKATCIEFYRNNVGELAQNPEFGKLKSTTIVDIIRTASASFPTDPELPVGTTNFVL